MTVQTTANLSGALLALVYKKKYELGAQRAVVYDQFAVDYTSLGADGKSMDELMRGTAVDIPFLSEMSPGVTAISQTADVTPQSLTDAHSSVTHTSRGEALQWSQQLDIETYTDYTAKAMGIVGRCAQESIELLAQTAACWGTWVEYVGGTARASQDADTSTMNASDAIFRKYHGEMLDMLVPGFLDSNGEANTWGAVMHPFVFHDIAESGNISSIGDYQQAGIHLNYELAKIGPFRLVVTPWSKVFYGAGADHSSNNFATTLSAATTPLATTLSTTADEQANIAHGLFWNIGTEETTAGGVFYPTNERIKPISVSGATTVAGNLVFVGQGPNGGLRYAHDILSGFNNNDSVYPIIFAGPESLVRVYATDVGQWGKTVGPKITGILDQFTSLGFKYWGGYGRIAENRLLRAEVSVSYEKS